MLVVLMNMNLPVVVPGVTYQDCILGRADERTTPMRACSLRHILLKHYELKWSFQRDSFEGMYEDL